MHHWLAHWGGLDNPAGMVYGFWSGSGSVFLPPVLSGLVVGTLLWWHHQCGVHHCYWYARRTTAAGERACWKHHPRRRRTAGDIHASHHEALARPAAAGAAADPRIAELVAGQRVLADNLAGLADAIRASLPGYHDQSGRGR